jgi:hypothetical protein
MHDPARWPQEAGGAYRRLSRVRRTVSSLFRAATVHDTIPRAKFGWSERSGGLVVNLGLVLVTPQAEVVVDQLVIDVKVTAVEEP